MIIPEIYEPGHPTPCAYIRLLQPFSHPGVIGDGEVRITDPDHALEYEADIIITQRAALRDTETVASRGAARAACRRIAGVRPR